LNVEVRKGSKFRVSLHEQRKRIDRTAPRTRGLKVQVWWRRCCVASVTHLPQERTSVDVDAKTSGGFKDRVESIQVGVVVTPPVNSFEVDHLTTFRIDGSPGTTGRNRDDRLTA
jgi:hypothetical protein